jgi:hypothetical protein
MLGVDLRENGRLSSSHGGRQQRFESVGDSGERGMHDHGRQTRGDPIPDYARNIVPIGGGGHAGAAEFENNPGLTIFLHNSDRTCDFNSA